MKSNLDEILKILGCLILIALQLRNLHQEFIYKSNLFDFTVIIIVISLIILVYGIKRESSKLRKIS